MKILNVTLGSDPEFFLFNEVTGMFVPSAMFLEGYGKEHTRDLKDGFAVLPDNVMVEMNIPPAKDRDGFVNNLITGFDRIKRDVITDPNITFKMQPSADFSQEDLETYNGLEFGCAPSENAYGLAVGDVSVSNKRFAGGHIHIGADDLAGKEEDIIELVKLLDKNLAIPAMELDKDDERRKFYGIPGEFRFTSYGLEYRSLSNFWLDSVELMQWAYDQVHKSINEFNEGVRISAKEVFELLNEKQTA